jgi:hypothetical protein
MPYHEGGYAILAAAADAKAAIFRKHVDRECVSARKVDPSVERAARAGQNDVLPR